MTRTRMAIAALCAVLGAACTAPTEGTEEESAGQIGEALAAPDVHDALVLDRRDDGARLVGVVEPVLANTDAERAVVLRVVRGSGPAPIDAALEGMRVLDARFAGETVVTVGADHVLRVHGPTGSSVLDTHAYGPISVAGIHVAYVRGEAPILELARADVATGTARTLTQGMAPAWSPALTQDGRAIVFVSAAEGTPRLYRVDGDGPPRALPPTQRTPGSPVGPRFEGALLVFEDVYGRAWLDLEQGRIVRTEAVPR